MHNTMKEVISMMKLDNLKGLLSVRSINTLKRLGYTYLEDVCPERIERRVRGKKTKKEIIDFIRAWDSMNEDDKIFAKKQADIKYNVEMYKVWEEEYISDNGNWSVTKNGIYFNYEDASYPIGPMEDVPDAVQKVYDELQGE